MMLANIFTTVEDWFSEYTASFLTGDFRHDHGFELKILHTKNVERHAEELVRFLETENGVDKRRRCGVKLAALLHDLGRFEQLKRYRTFNDSLSEDHGQIALDVMKATGLLDGLDEEDPALGEAVRFAVFVHNKLSIPSPAEEMPVLLAKIVRDADRIDIYRIMAEQMDKGVGPGQEAVFLHLDNSRTISDAVYESLTRGEMVRRDSLQGRTDFLCQILSWVQIMNFPYSCKMVLDAGHFSYLLSRLPATPRGKEVQRILGSAMEEKLLHISTARG